MSNQNRSSLWGIGSLIAASVSLILFMEAAGRFFFDPHPITLLVPLALAVLGVVTASVGLTSTASRTFAWCGFFASFPPLLGSAGLLLLFLSRH